MLMWWDSIAIALVLLLGVPHGGLDAAVARRVGWPAGVLPWLYFHVAYIGLALLVVGLWWWLPLLSLSLFLLISAIHFAASDLVGRQRQWLPWIAHAGLITVAVPVLQREAVEPLFAQLVGGDAAALMQILTMVFPLWLLSLVGYCMVSYRQRSYRKPLSQLMALLLCALVLPPLVTFAVYFCLSHSPGHMRREWQQLKQQDRRRGIYELVSYTLLAWAAGGAVFWLLSGTPSALWLQITFIGLAALTVPHMLLVDWASNKREASGV